MNNTKSSSTEPFAYIVFRYGNIFHAVFGGSSNLIAAFICLKSSKLRECPTFICIAFMNFSCFIYLFIDPLASFVSQLIGYDLQNQSIHYCRAEAFLDSYTLQVHAWILVFYTLELYLNSRIVNFRKKYLTSKIAAIICVIIAIILVPFNSPTWFIQKSLYPYVCLVTMDDTNTAFSLVFRVLFFFVFLVFYMYFFIRIIIFRLAISFLRLFHLWLQ